jgi:hypothetical protein
VNRLVEAGRKAVAAFTIQSKLKRANAMQELSDVLKEFDEKAENYDLVSSIDNKQPYETWRTN